MQAISYCYCVVGTPFLNDDHIVLIFKSIYFYIYIHFYFSSKILPVISDNLFVLAVLIIYCIILIQ